MKSYLGDSVYAENINGMIRLTTDNGFGPSNEIFLEDFVLSALISFAKKPTEQKYSYEQLLKAALKLRDEMSKCIEERAYEAIPRHTKSVLEFDRFIEQRDK